jgi:hypothetical protein
MNGPLFSWRVSTQSLAKSQDSLAGLNALAALAVLSVESRKLPNELVSHASILYGPQTGNIPVTAGDAKDRIK